MNFDIPGAYSVEIGFLVLLRIGGPPVSCQCTGSGAKILDSIILTKFSFLYFSFLSRLFRLLTRESRCSISQQAQSHFFLEGERERDSQVSLRYWILTEPANCPTRHELSPMYMISPSCKGCESSEKDGISVLK